MPRLSWSFSSPERGKRQAGFHLVAASSEEKLASGEWNLWNLNEKKSGQRSLVGWKGMPLQNDQTVFWKISVLDEKGKFSPWSKPATFTVGAERKLGKVTRTSGFESSNPVLNDIYDRSVATLGKRIEGYLAGDEKALGDGHAVWRSARELLFHYDSTPVMLDWIAKIHNAQDERGYFPGGPGQPIGPVVSDAGIAVPHAVWWVSGDAQMIRERWTYMENYMMCRELADPMVKGHAWGAPFAPGADLPPAFVDLCYFGLTSRLMSELAQPAQKPNNSIRFKSYSARVRKSFARDFLNEKGLLKLANQDAQVLAIRSAVMTPEVRQPIIDDLVKTVKPLRDLTGFGAKPFFPVLGFTGNQGLLYDIVSDPKGPWADKENHSFEASGATEWLMASVLGIEGASPGFQQIRLAPEILPGKDLTWAKGHYDSPVGRISAHWEKQEKGGLSYKCTIPSGILAIIELPMSAEQAINESGKTVEEAFGAQIMKRDEKAGLIQIITQSGSYHFTIQ